MRCEQPPRNLNQLNSWNSRKQSSLVNVKMLFQPFYSHVRIHWNYWNYQNYCDSYQHWNHSDERHRWKHPKNPNIHRAIKKFSEHSCFYWIDDVCKKRLRLNVRSTRPDLLCKVSFDQSIFQRSSEPHLLVSHEVPWWHFIFMILNQDNSQIDVSNTRKAKNLRVRGLHSMFFLW